MLCTLLGVRVVAVANLTVFWCVYIYINRGPPYLWKLANSFDYCGKASASAGSSGLSFTVSDADPKP